jgi:hypothetical protein
MEFTIKDIVSKKGNYAFLCKDHTHFKMCVKQAIDEGIVFFKTFGNWHKDPHPDDIEGYDYIISNYTKHLSDNNVCALMKNTGYEIQFYSRDRSNNNYGFDWSEWEIIDWTSLMRNSKINEIIK